MWAEAPKSKTTSVAQVRIAKHRCHPAMSIVPAPAGVLAFGSFGLLAMRRRR
jgi:hypothetical protein